MFRTILLRGFGSAASTTGSATIETDCLFQKSVLWEFSDSDRNGESIVSAAIEIDTRWEEGLAESISQDAKPIAINGTIFVDREIAEGSIMWLGELADLPVEPDRLVEVQSHENVPDIKGRVFQRTVTVKKWRESLPTIE